MSRKTIVSWVLGAVGCGLLAFAWLTPDRPAHAATSNIYAMNSGFVTSYIYVLNPSTMAVIDTLANLGAGSGRGVVTVGGVIYYTSNTSNNVYSYTLATHTDNGPLFAVSGVTGLGSMAYDGTDLWIADNGGSHRAFQYSLTGTLLKTVNLANATAGYSGMEYFVQGGQGRLIANRGNFSNTYDVYDTNGNLLTASFINAGGAATYTGIAFDGTNFLLSNSSNGSIDTFNGTTGAFIQSQVLNGFPVAEVPNSLWDISLDYSQTLPPGPATVPALSQWGLMLCGALLLAAGILMSRKRATA